MRYVDGQGNVYDQGCWLRRLSESRIFPVVGKNGSPLLQPGESLGLDGRGICLMKETAVPFRVRSVQSDIFWTCDENWSVLRKRQGNYSTIYEQDPSVWKFGLEDTIRQYYPNPNGDEFWLFPTPSFDVNSKDAGNGGSTPEYAFAYLIDDMEGGPKSRGYYSFPVTKFSVTVVIHSNSLKTQRAIDRNFLWDWDGNNSRNVFIAWFEGNTSRPVHTYPMQLRGGIDGPGSSSLLYGSAAVLTMSRTFSEPTWVGVADPIFRVHDLDSMFGTSYSDSSTIKIETVYQFART